ncbi:MAG: 5-(carboxyamino)imidazole ribonucleotide synthase [Saprospiraceae bacterium]|nr:5-(carboxyamino)imidazole ribonucleotide synthase [Saprospiraceae bacterium]
MTRPKIGILGGGQLGKMLVQAGSALDLDLHILDRSLDFPAAKVCPNFHVGDFTNYEDVLKFGRSMDVISVEIESINAEALEALEREGKAVFPQSTVIKIIRDKGLQKEFYREHRIPTSSYRLYDSHEEIIEAVKTGKRALPFVQKARVGGYDGRGVAVIRTSEDLNGLLPVPSVVEDLVQIEKELAVIVASNGENRVTFPPVEMLFHPTANLVEFLASPAEITLEQQEECNRLAIQVAECLQIRGLLAVELFLAKDGTILVNESAPRPHNSGHHTIEANVTSQFEQHLRAVLGLPLGTTSLTSPAVMVNLLGQAGHQGPTVYQGLSACLAIPDAHLHLYGKPTTRPYRKMGHATALGDTLAEAKEKGRQILDTLKIVSEEL